MLKEEIKEGIDLIELQAFSTITKEEYCDFKIYGSRVKD